MDKALADPENWFSLFWFRPDVLGSFSWENKYFLFAIPIVPLIYVVKWLLHFRFREKIEMAFFSRETKKDWTSLGRFIPPGIQSLFLAFVLVALARPQRTSQMTEQKSEGIDIILAIDISESMRQEDLQPNRLEAAKKVASDFIEGRNMDRIGFVLFAGEAFSLCPLTNDYSLLQDYVDEIQFDLITRPGTAIGSALAVTTNRMLESKSKTRIAVLLSDGDNTAGNLDPITAAKLAASYGIKLYTIAVGKDGAIPMGRDIFGNQNYIQNNLDETTLRSIAKVGDGQFFRATSSTALSRIFKTIDRFEKSEVKVRRYRQTQDYYQVYLSWAVVFFLLWLALKSSFMTNALED